MNRRTFLTTAAAPLAAQRAPRKRILLRTGWQMRNIGDVCFTPAMLGALQRFIPEAEVTCWAANIDEPARRMIRRDFPGARFLDGRINEPGKPTPPELLAAFEQTDLDRKSVV